MRRPFIALLLAAALASSVSPVLAQDAVETFRTTVDIVEHDHIDTGPPVPPYSATGDHETRPACISVFPYGTAVGDDCSVTDNPKCMLSSGWGLDECLGVDRGGHSRGKYL